MPPSVIGSPARMRQKTRPGSEKKAVARLRMSGDSFSPSKKAILFLFNPPLSTTITFARRQFKLPLSAHPPYPVVLGFSPEGYTIPTEPLAIAAGRITFIRQVTVHGNVHLLSQTFKVGKRLKGEYVKVVLDIRHGHLTVYRQGRIFKRWPYPLLKS